MSRPVLAALNSVITLTKLHTSSLIDPILSALKSACHVTCLLMVFYVFSLSSFSSSSFFSTCSVLISLSIYRSLLLFRKLPVIPIPNTANINNRTMTKSRSPALTFFIVKLTGVETGSYSNNMFLRECQSRLAGI
jgi:hypothetical protein